MQKNEIQKYFYIFVTKVRGIVSGKKALRLEKSKQWVFLLKEFQLQEMFVLSLNPNVFG